MNVIIHGGFYKDAVGESPSNVGLCFSSHPLVHGFIGQTVGLFVSTAEGVADFEVLEVAGEAQGLIKKGAERGALDLIEELHLLDHQLGVGDHAQALRLVLDGPAQDGQKAGVLGEVVGLYAEELAHFGHHAAVDVLDDGAVAGGAGIAPGTAVAVGDEGPAGGLGGGIGKEGAAHCLLVYRY